MDFFEAGATVIVLDALLADGAPGTIYRLGTDRLLDLGRDVIPTAHEVDPVHLLKRARALGERLEMVLLGIVPADASQMALGLTPALADAFPAVRRRGRVGDPRPWRSRRADSTRCSLVDDVVDRAA